VNTKPLSQGLVAFLVFSKILEGFDSICPLVELNLFLEWDDYIEVFVRVELKARSVQCFLSIADEILDDKHPI
jgi:hypothetical protein